MSKSPIDESVWQELVKLQEESAPGLVQSLVEQFCKDVPTSIQKMRTALKNNDAKALGMEAHKLKSACAYLGAFGMRDLCAHLETLTGVEHAALADRTVSQLDAEFAQVKQSMQERVTSR